MLTKKHYEKIDTKYNVSNEQQIHEIENSQPKTSKATETIVPWKTWKFP
jgi:hypothetical protein